MKKISVIVMVMMSLFGMLNAQDTIGLGVSAIYFQKPVYSLKEMDLTQLRDSALNLNTNLNDRISNIPTLVIQFKLPDSGNLNSQDSWGGNYENSPRNAMWDVFAGVRVYLYDQYGQYLQSGWWQTKLNDLRKVTSERQYEVYVQWLPQNENGISLFGSLGQKVPTGIIIAKIEVQLKCVLLFDALGYEAGHVFTVNQAKTLKAGYIQ